MLVTWIRENMLVCDNSTLMLSIIVTVRRLSPYFVAKVQGICPPVNLLTRRGIVYHT